MKRKNLKLIFLSLFLCLGISDNVTKVNANDNGAEKPSVKYSSTYDESYYQSIQGFKGDNLLEGLAKISQSNHKYYTTYGEIRGGNAFSDEDPNDASKVLDFYTGISVSNVWNSGSNWNREHVWPQSLSGGLYGESGAGSDIHHIRPTIPIINTHRNNGLFRDLPNTDTYKYYYNNVFTGCYRDSSAYFEPRNEAKGDVARILMYLYMHYSNEVSNNASYSYAGALDIRNVVYTDAKTKDSAWNMMVEWSKLDPVDDFESKRNNYCASVTGLRNPFIDHPEFATMIWDASYSGEGALLDQGSNDNEDYLRLNTYNISLDVDDTYQIEALTNINNPTYTYSSSNQEIASVSSLGLIRALKEGETVITVSVNDLSVNLNVQVKSNENNDDIEDIEGELKTYKKVTSSLSDWSGEYLIVNEDNKVAFNGSLTTLDAVCNNFSIEINDNTIQVSSSKNYHFNIEKTQSTYSIKSSSNYYIGQTSNANGLKSHLSTVYSNSISLNSKGEVDIISSGGAYLRFNATSGQERFRYFKSGTYTNQKAIHLYKLEEVNIDENESIKQEISKIETKVQLEFSYNYEIIENNNISKKNYLSFYNVNIKALANIPNEYKDYVDSYGISINSRDYECNDLFEIELDNILDLKAIYKFKAYVYIDEERIYLVEKEYSVYSMVIYYLNNASSLSLSEIQIETLENFKEFIENN